MKNLTFNSTKDLKNNINPIFVKKINGHIVNGHTGKSASLSVSNKHVMLDFYNIASQSHDFTFLEAPFFVEIPE
jgi:hypothetical protein